MIDHPFEALLLPGEKIVWTAQSKPAPRSWLSGWVVLVVGLVLLAFFGPRLFSVLKSCIDAQSIFALQFIGVGGVFGLIAPVLIGIFTIWIAFGLFKQPKTFIYGLSQTRAFLATASPKKRWICASIVQVGGTVEMTEDADLFTLNIPIRHTGEDSASQVFARLSKSNFETALALVNKIIGAPAP